MGITFIRCISKHVLSCVLLLLKTFISLPSALSCLNRNIKILLYCRSKHISSQNILLIQYIQHEHCATLCIVFLLKSVCCCKLEVSTYFRATGLTIVKWLMNSNWVQWCAQHHKVLLPQWCGQVWSHQACMCYSCRCCIKVLGGWIKCCLSRNSSSL